MTNTEKRNKERVDKLFPPFGKKIFTLIEECEKNDIDIIITQGLRTWEEQDALFAQGRTKPGKIVTKAKGGSSYHNFGLSVDFAPISSVGKIEWNIEHPDWNKVIKLAIKLGLESGSMWKTFKDVPHLQMTGGLTVASLRTLYKKGGLKACWVEVEKQLKNQGKL